MPNLSKWSRLDYSLRRYYVDEFHSRHIPTFSNQSLVLDLGGNKVDKRGEFNITDFDLRVIYANLSIEKLPDIQCYAEAVPFKSKTFDSIICAELLEHVPDPRLVLQEVYRILKPGGVLLITVPFLYHIHADPYDYGRYTNHYWRENLMRMGFQNIQIEKQGLFWSVIIDMLRVYVIHRKREGSRLPGLGRVLRYLRRYAVTWDMRHFKQEESLFSSYTTGFGIRAEKSLLSEEMLP